MYCTTTHEVITITEFCPEMNIDSIIDRFLTAWGKISLTTLINAWKLLFSAVDVSDDGNRKIKFSETVDLAHSITAPGFSDT